jgi:hypothetical protein
MHVRASSLQEKQVVNEMALLHRSNQSGHTTVSTYARSGTLYKFLADTVAVRCEQQSTAAFRSILRSVHGVPVRAIYSDEARFQLLMQQWHVERGATSSITEMAMCRSYLQIIGMGQTAIPMILRQIQGEGDEPDMWFVALQILTGVDPVTDPIRGDFKAMANSWIQWAVNAGYAW